VEIVLKKKTFIALPFIAICLAFSSCAFTGKIINENSFKNNAKAQFKEDFPAYEVGSVVIKQINQREKAAIIFYHKPGIKGIFTTEWKYYDRDENPNNLKEDWLLVEKGYESEIRIKKD
jgi:hypothetical protein